jgi:ribosomal-protein-alanine N-acetyltransferase
MRSNGPCARKFPLPAWAAARTANPDRCQAAKQMQIRIRQVDSSDALGFTAAARASRTLHKGWVAPPITPDAFADYMSRFMPPTGYGFVVVSPEPARLLGAINITDIVHGKFQSGYVGYFAFAGHERNGFMAQGLRDVVRHAFSRLRLHRLEANIQPENVASIALARSCGFNKEGYSPAYLKIGGRWRDHERWAIVRR